MSDRRTKSEIRREKALDEATDVVLLASRALVGVAARSLAETEDQITLVQYRALVALGARGEQNVGGLSDALCIHPSPATRLCDRLIVKGYIDRKTSVESRREVTLALSDSGRALVRAETARRRRAIRRIVGRLDVDTQLEIVEAFGALADAAEEVTDEAWKLGWTA